MTTTLLAAAALLVLFVGGGLVWTCALGRDRLDEVDLAALAPAVAVVAAAGLTLTALVVPWSFTAQSVAGALVWVVGALLLLARLPVRRAVQRTLRAAWPVLVPFVLCVFAVAAFGVVQGDPRDTVAYPGTVLSARA